MKFILSISYFISLIVFQSTLYSQVVKGNTVEGLKVRRVIDGDTIELSTGVKVRYIGVDTPETKHPSKQVERFGIEASEANKSLVEGKHIKIEFDAQKQDKYGRVLAYVYVDTIFVNAWLVKNGLAKVSTYPPNVKYQELFTKLQQEARVAKRGLWAPSSSKFAVEPKAEKVKPATTVYLTATGTKYHRDGCKYLAKSKIKRNLSEVSSIYGACKVCKPPVLNSISITKPTKTKSYTSGRCQATTKKGTRCKRSAKSGSSYCWQHVRLKKQFAIDSAFYKRNFNEV